MFDQMKNAFQSLTGQDNTAEDKKAADWALVREFVATNPWSSTRLICHGVKGRSKHTNEILKARASNGEVITRAGKGGATLYAIASTDASPILAEPVSGPITEPVSATEPTSSSKPSPAVESIASPDLGDALLGAGVNASPCVPEQVTAPAVTSTKAIPVHPVEQKIESFSRNNPEATAREISGGLELPLGEVRIILAALTEAGTLIVVSGSENTSRYRVSGFVPEPIAPPVERYIPRDVVWGDEQRRRGLAEWAAAHPAAPRVLPYNPTDAEVESAKPKPIILTPEQRAEVAEYERLHGQQRNVNPNAFIVR